MGFRISNILFILFSPRQMSAVTLPYAPWKAAALRALTCFILYLAGWASVWPGSESTGVWLFIVACVAGGWGLAKESWQDLRAFKLEIHFLMFAAAVASAVLGQWPEAALLLGAFLRVRSAGRLRGRAGARHDGPHHARTTDSGRSPHHLRREHLR